MFCSARFCNAIRGFSSVGRALPWHGRGQGFESPNLHVLHCVGPRLHFLSAPYAVAAHSVSRLRSLPRWRSFALSAFAGGPFRLPCRRKCSTPPPLHSVGPRLHFASAPYALAAHSVSTLRSLPRWRSFALSAFAGGPFRLPCRRECSTPPPLHSVGPRLHFASAPYAVAAHSVSTLRSLPRWRSFALSAFAGGPLPTPLSA